MSESELGRGSLGRQEGRVWRDDCVGVEEFSEQLDVEIMTFGLEEKSKAAKVLTGSECC